MPKLAKGKIFLRCAAHALLVGLKEIPGVGIAVELGRGWFDIFRDEQRKAGFGERLEQLEQAGAILPGEARTIADEFIADQRSNGIAIVEEQAAAIRDLLMFMPATIKERTQATLRQARQRGTDVQTVLPITAETSLLEQEAFYHSLFPARRPRFQTDDSVPHGLAGWCLGELLGTGGFGEVWEVRHRRLRYAIKFFLDEVSERVLANEAEMLFDVHEKLPRHANIVHLNSLNLDTSPYWLLFEFVEGGTLESLLRAAPLSWQESLSLFQQIVAGVAAVHQIGIVHRDLKPANILLTADGIPKITDFGIGKVMAENEAVLQATRTQYTTQGFGSMGYMSKEQRRGEKAHPADDTYALGVLLWQMLVQTLAAPDLDWAEELQQKEVPEALQNVVFSCLNKSREQRPKDAGILLEMLRPDRFPKPVRSEVGSEVATGEKFAFEMVTVDTKGKIISRKPHTAIQKIEQVNGVPLAMVYIPSGEFMMGSNERNNEKPIHKVTIKQPFYMGKYPVTQAQWQAVMGNNPANFKGDNRPVEKISWEDAVAFCEKLSKLTNQTYRLPSEAEWEYTCRAGTTTKYYFGETISDKLANYNRNIGKTTEVGNYPPNAFGLYDMCGNVWEWCADGWHYNYNNAPTDGSVWENNNRVLRGGSWYYNSTSVRSAFRYRYEPTKRNDIIGFRVVFS